MELEKQFDSKKIEKQIKEYLSGGFSTEVILHIILIAISLAVAAVPSWGPWSEWSGCSHTCGGGKRLRLRSCLDGDFCKGNSTDYDECNTQECPSSKQNLLHPYLIKYFKQD